MNRAVWWMTALLVAGCAKRSLPDADPMEGVFRVGRPSADWERQDSGGADYAWFHADHLATIYADSNCRRRFQEGPLSDLLTHLTAGIAKGSPIREESMRLDDRAALMRVYDGAVDGVPVRLGAVVVNKDRCTYDMVYVAPPESFEAGWADFVTVTSGFRTVGSP